MAGSSRKSIGLNLALTLMAWGFFCSFTVLADENLVSPTYYYFFPDHPSVGERSSVSALCAAGESTLDKRFPNNWVSKGYNTPAWNSSGGWAYNKTVNCRYENTVYPPYGDGVPSLVYKKVQYSGKCESPYVFDSSSTMCHNCPSTAGQTKELKGPEAPIMFSGGAGYVMWATDADSSYCVDSCSYSGAAKTACYAVSSGSDRGYCNFMVAGLGDSCDADSAPLAAVGAPITAPTDPVDPPDPGDNGGGDTGGGNNGGGSDGGGNSGSPVTPPDPADTSNPDAATSGDVATLGNRLVDATYATANGVISAINGLGNKVDGVGNKVDGLGDKIDDLGDSLQGEPYSEGEGEGAGNADGIGDEAGDSLADLINSAVDEAKQARTDSFNEEVDKVDGMLGEWFGEDASGVGGSILDGLFPKSSSCSDFNVVWHTQGYSLSLPVCELTRLKSILEWVFGILTAIAVWRILMNTLNQAAASAVRYS